MKNINKFFKNRIFKLNKIETAILKKLIEDLFLKIKIY